MKYFPLLLITMIFTFGTSCKKYAPEVINLGGLASGHYKGFITEPDGTILENEFLEIHKVTDNRVSIQPENADFDNGRASAIEMNLEKHGAAVHQVLGTEANGTFTLDLAINPDQFRLRLPSGYKFDGIRIQKYNE